MHLRQGQGFVGRQVGSLRVHCGLLEAIEVDLEDRRESVHRLEAAGLAALKPLDRAYAEAGHLGQLLLGPAPLQPQFLDQHLYVPSSVIAPTLVPARFRRHVINPTTGRQSPDKGPTDI